jgi:hypothetical protein
MDVSAQKKKNTQLGPGNMNSDIINPKLKPHQGIGFPRGGYSATNLTLQGCKTLNFSLRAPLGTRGSLSFSWADRPRATIWT